MERFSPSPDPFVFHGGAVDRAKQYFGLPPNQDWLDLSTGISPFAWPIPSFDENVLKYLPTQQQTDDFCRVVRRVHHIPDRAFILPVPGEQTALQWLPLCGAPQGPVVLPERGYRGHFHAWQQAGREIVFSDNPLSRAGTAAVIVVINPNNPDGTRHCVSLLSKAADQQARTGGWLIVDEAFCNVTPENTLLAQADHPALLILRSFGKFFGLPGLRLGWVAGMPPVLSRLSGRMGSWPVSTLALEIGQSAEADIAWQNRQRERLATQARRLEACLLETSLKLAGGTDLFRLVRTPDQSPAWPLFESLGRSGILVRPFQEDPSALRFGLFATQQQEEKLKTALSKLRPFF